MAATIRHKLTPKQIKFVGEYVKHGNATQATLAAYNVSSDTTARAMGSELLANPNVCSKIEHICKRRGLTEDWAVRILKRQGKATKPVVIKDSVEEWPDNPARLTAAQTALKLHGHLRTNEVNIADNSQHLTLAVSSPDDIKRLESIASMLSTLKIDNKSEQTGEIIDVDKYRVD